MGQIQNPEPAGPCRHPNVRIGVALTLHGYQVNPGCISRWSDGSVLGPKQTGSYIEVVIHAIA